MAWRYLAQNILTGEWLDLDLPLIRDPESPRWEMSGPGSLSGRVSGDHPSLRRVPPKLVLPDDVFRVSANAVAAGILQADTILAEWSTVIYAELDGEIVWGGIIQRSEFDGADWQIEAFGFTSYANGIPYTGSYQKLIDVDPGRIWSKLWSHVQGQPDGNLGLQSIMPDQLGPNVGTKDDPYELSWWEAKDVGDELQQLASDSPFDYVESHSWATRAAKPGTGALPLIRYAYGNLQGGYDGNDKKWMKSRADDQVELIGSLQVDLFEFAELHEETSSAMPQGADQWFAGRLQAKLSPFWKVARGDAGNQLGYRSDVWTVIGTTIRQGIDLPSGAGSGNLRSATRWTVQHVETGWTGEAGGYHLHANDDGGASRRQARLTEAADVDVLFPKTGRPPAIVSGDWNSWSMGSDEVYGLIEAQAGLVPLNKRTKPKNADLNSNTSGKKQGHWIDNILTRPGEFDIVEAAGIPTHGVTDHHLWIYAVLQPLTAGSGSGDPTSRKVKHTVELSYPRAGRRRLDLVFVQGDNVLEVVQPVRNGETFANSVITLGKGEGSKTLRGEDTVRDGRLRRPVIYTDKLAGTKSRVTALAKRERGWRNLEPQVESILVDGTHPNAPMASWALGDDILLQAYGLPNFGALYDWYRITSWSLVTDTTARLYLTRADAFTYGPVVPAPSDDLPDSYDDAEVGTR